MQGYQVTLTTANTVYNLWALVTAINANFVDTSNKGDISVQVEDDGGTQKIYLGDANLSSSRYAWKGTVGDSSPHFRNLAGVYAMSDTASKKLNISIEMNQ